MSEPAHVCKQCGGPSDKPVWCGCDEDGPWIVAFLRHVADPRAAWEYDTGDPMAPDAEALLAVLERVAEMAESGGYDELKLLAMRVVVAWDRMVRADRLAREAGEEDDDGDE